ncbi:agmatine deiminase [Limosilactobacillus frumenti]|uniref:agmatine deiminase n=1 Tax=Limosilactobacillus frumenti TaxID=104955 RepID=UPI0015EBF027|nr:agmatine deiminase [Limosilactobacillus frumenti]MBA2913901.1 agmatine deiminase [Limosilactobacillus frumenti]
MLIENLTPKRDHFTMAAEFNTQQRSFMIWPERQDNWRNGGKPAQKAFTNLAKVISQFQPITMFVNQGQYKNAKEKLTGIAQVVEMSSDDAWAKDVLPIYVHQNKIVRAVNFEFNAWGGLVDGLYFPWDKDNQLAIKVADLTNLDYYSSDVILEGCSILTDGEGTIITTEDVLLAEDRNTGMTKEFMESVLKEYLGVKKVIYLQHGYFLDETGGDIDNMINFVKPGELVLTWTDDQDDPLYEECSAAYDILSKATDAKGRHFKIHKLHVPAKQVLTKEESEGNDLVHGLMPRSIGQRLTATYVNFITINRAIIFPTFNDPHDKVACEQLTKLFPDRQIIGFPVREVLIGGGGLHTIVNSLPRF